MSLEEEIRKKFGKMQKISLERLQPPKAIPPDLMKSIMSHDIKPMIKGGKRESISSEKGEKGNISLKDGIQQPITKSVLDSKLGIDYETIARSSEFQRFIYFLLTGKTHRGKQVDLRSEVKAKMTKFRGSGMGAVINEFKAKVARLREK